MNLGFNKLQRQRGHDNDASSIAALMYVADWNAEVSVIQSERCALTFLGIPSVETARSRHELLFPPNRLPQATLCAHLDH
jgi:hypothetical protein